MRKTAHGKGLKTRMGILWTRILKPWEEWGSNHKQLWEEEPYGHSGILSNLRETEVQFPEGGQGYPFGEQN